MTEELIESDEEVIDDVEEVDEDYEEDDYEEVDDEEESDEEVDDSEAEEEDLPNFVYSVRINNFIHEKGLKVSRDVTSEINRVVAVKLYSLSEVSEIIGKKRIPPEYLHYKEYDGELELIKTTVAKKYTKDLGVSISTEDLKRLNFLVIERIEDAVIRCQANGRKTVKEHDI